MFMIKHKKRERERDDYPTDLVCCKLGTNRLNKRRECVSPCCSRHGDRERESVSVSF